MFLFGSERLFQIFSTRTSTIRLPSRPSSNGWTRSCPSRRRCPSSAGRAGGGCSRKPSVRSDAVVVLRCSSLSVRYGVRSSGTYRGAGTWAFSKTVGPRFFRRRRGGVLRRRRAPNPRQVGSRLDTTSASILLLLGSDMSVNPGGPPHCTGGAVVSCLRGGDHGPWVLRSAIGLRGASRGRWRCGGAESDRMSLAHSSRSAFLVLLLASAALGRGHLNGRKAARRAPHDGLEQETHRPAQDSSDPSVLQDAKNILVAPRAALSHVVARVLPLRPHVSLAQRYAAFRRETLPAAEALRSASYSAAVTQRCGRN